MYSPNLVNALQFAKPGIDMNFGISHLQQTTGSSQLDQDLVLQQKILEQDRKYTPNRLASEQEFGRVDCAMEESR